MILNKSSPRYRELLWRACCVDSAGNPDPENGKVFCNICHLEVTPGAAWDESHEAIPKAWGGALVWVGHRDCNRNHGAKVVTPMVAKAKRQKRKHLGIDRPGLGKAKLPAGRNSPTRKKLNGEVVPREARYEKHRRVMEGRVVR